MSLLWALRPPRLPPQALGPTSTLGLLLLLRVDGILTLLLGLDLAKPFPRFLLQLQ